ncbi:MAG: DNA (cytosine-5-)-methyltransferase [Candidatus Thorarchaeota archaeon]
MTLTDSESTIHAEDTRLLFNHVSTNLSELDMQMIRSIPAGGNWSSIPLSIAKKSSRVMKIKETGGRTTYYGRLQEDLPSYTINTYFNRPGNGTFIHPTQDRLISFREAARLQSFPDSYKFLGSNTSIYKQIGNAVPPLLSRAIGKTLKPGLCIDVFSGAGGLSLGLNDTGHRVILAAEKQSHMLSTYSHNHPDTESLDVDLSYPLGIESFIEMADNSLHGRTLNLLAGGPPCQGFSTAGKWNLADPRNILVFSMLRMVKHLQPENVIIENVTGIRIQKGGDTLTSICEHLDSLDYESQWFQLNSEQYGVPQRRRRIFIVANRNGNLSGPPPAMFSSLISSRRRNKLSESDDEYPAPISVGDAISDLPAISPGAGEHEMEYDPSWISSHYQMLMRGHMSYEQFLRYQYRES